MAVQSVEEHGVLNLPRVPTLVIQRANIQGVSLPPLGLSCDRQCAVKSPDCGDVTSVQAISSTRSACCKQAEVFIAVASRSHVSGRLRKVPKRPLSVAQPAASIHNQPTVRRVKPGDWEKDGCKVKQNSAAVVSDLAISMGLFGRQGRAAIQKEDGNSNVHSDQNEQCASNSGRLALGGVSDKPTCISTEIKSYSAPVQNQKSDNSTKFQFSSPTVLCVENNARSAPDSASNVKNCSKGTSTSTTSCASNTRQSSAVTKRLRNLRKPRSGTVVIDRHKSTSKRRQKRVAFLDSSDDVSDEGTVKEKVGPRKRKRIGASPAGKSPTRKRRKLSGSADEVPAAVPTAVSSAEVGSKVTGDERWTCSSDDDFAVSMRLEELQEEESIRRSALTGHIRGEEGVPIVCPPPKKIVYPPSILVNVTGMDKKSSQNALTGSCRHCENLEIDPSAIVVSGECAVNTPAVCTEESQSTRVSIPGGTNVAENTNSQTNVGIPMQSEKAEVAASQKPARGRGRAKSRESGKDCTKILQQRGRKPAKGPANVPKKRGRPRKDSIETPQWRVRRLANEVTANVPKKRGRPRKDSIETSQWRVRRLANEVAANVPKKRGRPRKDCIETPQWRVRRLANEVTANVPKKRGRPTKDEKGSVSISKGLKPARGRGRPPKSAGVCGKDHRETPQRRGCKPAKESAPNEPKRPRGRPRKTESDKLKKASGKPGSVPIQGSSVSPQSQLCSPQNGEDSGYPGSISSASSKTLKSPQDISPTYILVDDTTVNHSGTLHGLAQHNSDVIITQSGTRLNSETSDSVLGPDTSVPLQQHQGGSVTVADLGMFSSELTETTTIMNFPMPDPQWEWSAIGVDGANTNELCPVNCALNQESDVIQSLFDPSKMIIAKVESLGEDCQFNEYLNEILESEEVIDCLNSLNIASSLLAAPQQLQPTAQVPSTDLEVGTSAVDNTAPPPPALSMTVTTSQIPSTSGGFVPSCAETVAAYVAAETNLVPFAATDCLKTVVDSGSQTCPTVPTPLLGVIEDGECPQYVNISLHPDELKPGVMWSQTGVDDTSLQAPKPTQQQQQENVCDPVKCDVKQPQPAPSTTVKPLQEKRRIVRVKRRLNRKMVDSSTAYVGQSDCNQKMTVDEAQSLKSSAVSSETGGQAHPSEVKSRNGRLIKPSWKAVQAKSSQPLKHSTSPGTNVVQGKECTDAQTCAHAKKEGVLQHNDKLKKAQICPNEITPSLSLATVVGTGIKQLPDIPTTPCSPNPSVSLPSTSRGFSMSLDDILRQMNPSEKSPALEFADSLLARAPSVGMSEETDGQKEKKEDVGEVVEESGGGTEREDCEGRRCASVVTQSADVKTSVGVDESVDLEKSSTRISVPKPASSTLPQTPQHTGPATTERVTGSPDHLPITAHDQPNSQPTAFSDPVVASEVQMRFKASTSVTGPEEDYRVVSMELCDSDSSDERVRGSPGFKRQRIDAKSKRLLRASKGASECEDGAEDRIELFAEDVDLFTNYTMDEKKRNTSPPQMPTPPREMSPMPFKKQQVVQWVEQQRSLQSVPYTRPSLKDLGRLQKHRNRFCSSTPLPPPPPPPPSLPLPSPPPLAPPTLPPLTVYPLSAPPTFNSHPRYFPPHYGPENSSSNVYHRLGGEHDCPTQMYHPPQGSRSSCVKLCRDFLRGHCNYKNCKYSHTPLDSVSDAHLENIFLHLSLEMIPQDIAKRYVVKSCSPVKNWFPVLIQLVRGLVNKSWESAVRAYSKLSVDGVVLSPSLLSRFLELCREQIQHVPLPNPFVQLHKLAHEVLQRIRNTQGSCTIENYHATLRILDASKQPSELLDVYQCMKSDGHLPSLDIIHLVLRGGSCTDDRILQLLNDSKTCHSTTIDIARVANSLLEKASPQLLSRNSDVVSLWVSGVNGVLDKLGQDALLKLFILFVSAQNWSSLLVLLEQSPKAIVGLETRLCKPISCMVSQQPALSDRAVVILEMMSDESLSGVSAEGWNTVLTQCVLPGTSQRITKFCRVMSRCNKCLSREALDALLGMVIDSCQPPAGMGVLGTHLQFTPPVVPSMAVLGNFCELLDQNKLYKDLFWVVDTLLQCSVEPSLAILQSFVNSCNKEKTYSRLAAVVKRAKEGGLRLEKTFYQRALVLLRQWGQDQMAITNIYKALRKIDTESPSLSTMGGSLSHCSAATSLHRELHADSGRSTTGSLVSQSSSRPCSSKSNKSLEGIFEKTNKATAKPGVLALLESNGRQGQFGAMVSILFNLRDSKSTYSADVVLAVWRAITESEHKPANAFSNLLEQLKLTQPPTKDGFLCPCDHWLVTQLGIALLKMYTDTEHWQSGFVILHHLHRYKIRYITNCKPFAPLPPLKSSLPSPYGLAKTAVTTCLRVDNLVVAVDVLSGCDWLSSYSPEEHEERTQLLVTVAERCLEASMYEDCCRCLQELSCLSAKSKHFTPVAKLHNRLLENTLSASGSDVDLSRRIYSNMNNANFLCVPRNFSLLLEKLCNLLQLSTARELCQQAIDKKFYPPVTLGDLFSVYLPPSIHHIEVCSLIKQHLHRMSRELEGKLLLPLIINFDKGTKYHVEQALTKDLDPPLPPSFSDSTSDSSARAIVSQVLLLQWLSTQFPTSHFHIEREGVCSQELSSVASSSSAARDEKAVAAVVAKSTVLHGFDIYTSDSDSSTHAKPLNAGPFKQQRMQFRAAICRTIVTELKPFYQAEKFNSYEDYLHLVKKLTTRVCKSSKSKPSTADKWDITDSVRSEVRDLVNEVMSKCTTYTPESDIN